MALERLRRFRFSLRTFLIIITLVCCIFAYYILLGRAQRDVVRAIQQSGGVVVYENEFDTTRMYISSNSSWVPQWCIHLLGKDFFFPVVAVTWSKSAGGNEPHVTDQDLKSLAALPDLIAVSIEGQNVTAEGLAVLQDLRKLQWLGVDVSMTPAVIEKLKNLTGLKTLIIYAGGDSSDLREIRSALPKTNISWPVGELAEELEQKGQVKVPID